MEINNYGALDAIEYRGKMDEAGKVAWNEHYKIKRNYLKMNAEVQEFMIKNLNPSEFKILSFIFFDCYKGLSNNSMWIKRTSDEIAESTGISKTIVKNTLKDFEDKGIIKRYKRHNRDKQHILVQKFETWKSKI